MIDWVRLWIVLALWFSGMILSLIGIIASKRECKEAIDWIRLGKSAALTFGGAVGMASIWPVATWQWAPGDVVTVLASGFGANAGLTKGLQAIFPKKS